MKAKICLALVAVGAMLGVASVVCDPEDGILCKRGPGLFYGNEPCKFCCLKMNGRDKLKNQGGECWCKKTEAELRAELGVKSEPMINKFHEEYPGTGFRSLN